MAESMLELSVADGDSCPVITLSGQADLTNVAPLDELITAQLSRGMARLVVDASELSFADSMALRTLVLAALILKDRGGGMILLRPQRPVTRMLALFGVDQLITVDAEPRITPAQEAARNLPSELALASLVGALAVAGDHRVHCEGHAGGLSLFAWVVR